MNPPILHALLARPRLVRALPAQAGSPVDRSQLPPELQAVAGFVLTLVVGGLLVGLAPRYVDRVVEQVREEPGASFLWGVGLLALFVGVVFLLAITVVGIVLVVPLTVAFVLLAFAGNALGYVAVFDGTADRPVALLFAAILAGIAAAVPVLGDFVGFVVTSLGIGSIVQVSRN